MGAVERPCERLADRPAARPLPVEPELDRQPFEAAADGACAVSELERANDRRDPERTFAHERLRVDREPWLPPRGEDVVAVQVLMEEDLVALAPGQLRQGRERCVEQPPLE